MVATAASWTPHVAGTCIALPIDFNVALGKSMLCRVLLMWHPSNQCFAKCLVYGTQQIDNLPSVLFMPCVFSFCSRQTSWHSAYSLFPVVHLQEQQKKTECLFNME